MGVRAVTYQDYLNGENWKIIREEILKRDNNVCRICKATATLVHHFKYTREILEGKNCAMLVSLCQSCHYKCHHDYEGRTLGPKDSSRKTTRLLFGRLQKGFSNRNVGIGFAELYKLSGPVNSIVAQRLESLRNSNL